MVFLDFGTFGFEGTPFTVVWALGFEGTFAVVWASGVGLIFGHVWTVNGDNSALVDEI